MRNAPGQTLPRWRMAGLSLAMLLPSLDTSIVNAALPALATSFRASFPVMQWVLLAYLLALTSLIVAAGSLGDRIGRRRTLLTGIGLFTAASLLCGVTPSIWLLVAARVAQGVGAAMMISLTLASTSELVPTNRAGSVLGWLGSVSAIGTSLGPSIGGLLAAGFGWRTIFLVNIPLGLAAWWLVRRTMPADRPEARRAARSFDLTGALLLVLTLLTYALAMTIGHGRFGWLNLMLFVAAAASAAVFYFVETRVPVPFLQLSMFRRGGLGAGMGMSLLTSAVVMTTMVVGPFYLSAALYLDALAAGTALSVGPLVAALTGVLAGRMVDRFGARSFSITGLLGVAAGSSLLAMLPTSWGLAGYLVPIGILTAGYAAFQAANNTVLLGSADPGERGIVSGMLSLSRNLGLITGASLMGTVFAWGSGLFGVAGAPPHAIATGMRLTFTLAAVLSCCALTIACLRRFAGQRRFTPQMSSI